MSEASLGEFRVMWLSGKSASMEPARLLVSNGVVHVFAHRAGALGNAPDAMPTPSLLASAPVPALTISERLGNVPYRISFPDGSVAVADDHRSVENALHLPTAQGWLPKLEANPIAVAVAIFGLIAMMGFLYTKFIPAFAEFAAHRVPRSAERKLGEYALQGMDRFVFNTSYLSETQREPHIASFKKLAKAAGLEDEVNLQFRHMAPNALALPGGTVILTDGLVQVMKGEERLVAAVLAHELGHIHHRHSLRQIIEGSASALLVSVVAGDVSGMSGLVTTAPIVLSSLAYTRAGERESDQYAFSLLRKTGYSPNDFGDAMQRFDIMDRCLRLREKDRDDAKDAGKPYKDWPNPMQNDESDTAPTSTPEGATRRNNKPSMRGAICYTDPDSYIKGREAEIAALIGDEKPQTGYLHTHPVTQERIEAARAAAKQSS